MKISVIVPIYKVEKYLYRCVDSILAQTYRDLEVILVDDGSPDRCPEICDAYARKDNRVKVIHKPNGGLSDARNAGLAIAAGEWLAFVDSDDWIEQDMYEILLRNAQQYGAEISVGGVNDEYQEEGKVTVFKSTFDGEESVECLSPVQAMRKHLTGSWAAWDKIYKRSVFEGISFPVGEINEDEPIMLKLLDRCTNVVYTNRVFYHYIHRPESITTSSFSPKKLIWIKHCRDNLDWVRAHHPEVEKEAMHRLVGSMLWAMREMALSNNDFPDEVRKIKADIKHYYNEHKMVVASKQERIRLFAVRYLPFGLYRKMERLLLKRHGGMKI